MLRLVTSPHIYECEPTWAWAPRAFIDYDLWLVLEGRGQLMCEKPARQVYQLQTGTAFILGPGTQLSATHHAAQPLRVFAAHFMPSSDEMARELATAFPPGGAPYVHVSLSALGMMAAMAEECAAHQGEAAEDQLRRRSLLQAMVLHVLHARRSAAAPPAHARLAPCVEEIRRAPGREWLPAEMARRTGFSVPQFNRHFRAMTGQSPRQYVIHRRVERAILLLQETRLSIAHIADALGYTDTFFFHRQFRRVTGATPLSYRSGSGGGGESRSKNRRG